MTSPRPPDLERSLIAPRTSDRWPRGIAYQQGFHILGTPIGFGNASKAELRFVSSLDDRPPRRGSRVVASRFIASAVGADERRIDALGLDYHQMIKLGRMEMHLFPSGLGPGASQFQVVFKGNRILYSGGVCLRKPLSTQPIDIPQCDLLLLDARPADPKPPAPLGVAQKLAGWVDRTLAAGAVPVVAAGSVNAAFDVMWALDPLDIPVRAQRGLFETFRRTESYRSFSPRLKRLEQRVPPSEVVLYPAGRWPRSRLFDAPSAKSAYAGPGREAPAWAEAAFRLGEGEDRTGIVSYVTRTGASQVALGGPGGDDRLVEMLTKAGIETFRVTPPVQIPLPFR